MIASLSGTIQEITPHSVVLDVNGVGYEVFATQQTLGTLLTKKGQDIFVFTYQHIRENLSELYGFLDQQDKQMFLALLIVSGIGPKVALSILNAASVKVLRGAVASQDSSILEKVSGIGQKKAQKIILELKDKIEDIDIAEGASVFLTDVEKDVIEALAKMGYPRTSVQNALRTIPQDLETVQEKIKATLQLLSNK